MMKITRQSQLTGATNTMCLDVTLEQMQRYFDGDGLIQNIFPQLTPDEREFIHSGITPEEWLKYFGSEK